MVLKIELDKNLERKFRESAMKKYGYIKGSLKKASEDAIKDWLNEDEELPRVKDPIKLIEGIMSHLRGKYTSVELQHEAKRLWIK